ncbi:MAG: hypothetical protein VCF25_32285 [Candidatus Poribacteria bacterium]
MGINWHGGTYTSGNFQARKNRFRDDVASSTPSSKKLKDQSHTTYPRRSELDFKPEWVI